MVEYKEELKDVVIFTNPAWNLDFLRLFLQLVKHLQLPFVILLKRNVDHRQYFNKIFGTSLYLEIHHEWWLLQTNSWIKTLLPLYFIYNITNGSSYILPRTLLFNYYMNWIFKRNEWGKTEWANNPIWTWFPSLMEKSFHEKETFKGSVIYDYISVPWKLETERAQILI